ncbi:MAG: response regulator [Acidobacteriota bacterium]|nr:response regulator [Acidobacteriota bacterium]
MTDDARVLIVEGDAQLRALLQQALIDRDVPCDSAASVPDALAYLGPNRYALLLLHLEMPEVESVLEYIRSMRKGRRPIVLITADVRSPKDAIDTELVQIIIRRPLRVSEVAGMIRACLEFVPSSGSDR